MFTMASQTSAVAPRTACEPVATDAEAAGEDVRALTVDVKCNTAGEGDDVVSTNAAPGNVPSVTEGVIPELDFVCVL